MADGDSWYDRKVLPHLIDFACGLPMISAQRRKVVPQAAGRVLEVGMGTGLNLRFYDAGRVRSLVAVDPAGQMHPMAQRRSAQAGIPVELHAIPAERLPLPTGSIDCVVCTYTLCSIGDPVAALTEMRRVLAPGGRLLFAEHGLAPDAEVVRWQRRVEPWWSKIAGGCRLTRDVPLLLREAGFRADTEAAYVSRPKLLHYQYWGTATAP